MRSLTLCFALPRSHAGDHKVADVADKNSLIGRPLTLSTAFDCAPIHVYLTSRDTHCIVDRTQRLHCIFIGRPSPWIYGSEWPSNVKIMSDL